MIFGIMILLILLAAAFCDIRKKEISLLFIVSCGAVSLLRIAVSFYEGAADPKDVLVSMIPGAILLLTALVTREGVGYGDGLLLLFAGPALGGTSAVLGAVAALFASGLFSGLLLTLKKAGRKTRLPFVPFLSLGMGVMLLAKV
jgi:leader peptidase (prepilin peptidase)/N-methyltransferase